MMKAEKEDMPMEWNDRLAAARKAAGLSQEALASGCRHPAGREQMGIRPDHPRRADGGPAV